MNTKIISGLVVAVVVLGGGYMLMSRGGGTDNGAAATAAISNAKGTLADIMKLTGSNECDISMKDVDATAKGKIYLNNGKIRGDFSAMVNEKEISSSMISKDGFVYTWTNLYPQGFKTEIPANADAASIIGAGGLNTGVTVDYSCKAWTLDESVFKEPANITFGPLPAQNTAPAPTTETETKTPAPTKK